MQRAGKSIPFGWWLPLLVLLALAAHWRALPFSFFSDDFSVIHKLGARQDLSPGTFFRPLPDWTLWLQYRLHGPDAWAFRFVNVLLLALNGWLVALLAKKLMRPDAAVLAGALFVLYPFHLEPQLWIIGRSTAMAALFVLLALNTAASEAQPWPKAIGVFFFGFLGTLCYESALLLPLMLVAWFIILQHADKRGWHRAIGASAIAVAVHLVVRALLINRVANEYGSEFFTKPLSNYLGMVAKVLGRSFLPPCEEPSVQTVRFALLFVVIAVVGIWFWRTRKSEPQTRRVAVLLTALFGIASIIAIVGGVSTRTSESDRFLYLPSAFLCMLIAMCIDGMRSKGLARGLVVIAAVSWIMLLRNGMENWRIASETIERIIAETPEPPRDGRLLVSNLPGDHKGAYIFRHGFKEALMLNGRAAEGVLHVREDLGTTAITDSGDTLMVRDADARYDASAVLKPKP
ncbi:MAG: glycosyltransferase family 39 protein [Flavobacteriales bacterium]|nr:glycosyltransferase family 39 protein [Flavobacteriales bacterium]